MTYTQVSILEAGGDIIEANNYHAAMVARSQAADFAPYVLKQLKREAKTKGYELKITKEVDIKKGDYYYIVMNYKVELPFLDINKEESLCKIAW